MATKRNIKRGRLSIEEKEYISSHATSHNAEQMAKKLGRSTAQVQEELDRFMGLKSNRKLSLEAQLKTRPEWRQFQKQFSPEEQEEFQHQYVQIMSQMKDNQVMPTEELQVFQVITLKILIDRTLEEQKMAIDDLYLAQRELESLRKQGAGADPDEIERYENLYESAKRTNKECADRYKIYSDKQDKMLSTLKATRDQRIKNLENSKTSIYGFLRLLLEEDQRRDFGDEAGVMKIASKKEKERLSKIHTFADGEEDYPIFSAETVLKAKAELGRPEIQGVEGVDTEEG